MDELREFICYVFICIGIIVANIPTVHTEVFEASACHSGSNACNQMSLQCNTGGKIRILTMKYGVKTSDCNSNNGRCLQSSRNGCCAYTEGDCTEYFNKLHAYNLHKQCSGQPRCDEVTVPNKNLATCDNKVSTYVQVSYECVPEVSFISFCGGSRAANDVNLLFSSDSNDLNGPTNCQCYIQSPTSVIVEYVDVRMFKQNDASWASQCSSASLFSEPPSTVNTTCEVGANEHDNFIYKETWTGDAIVLMKLENVLLQNKDDMPKFVWLNLIGTQQVSMSVSCTASTDFFPTTSAAVTTMPSTTRGSYVSSSATSGTTYVSTSSDSTTQSNSSKIEDDGSNTGAIVAGILVPIILLTIICLVLFFIWRKRGFPWKWEFGKSKSHTVPNSYLDGADLENSCENDVYAEIGFVPDQPNTSPCYDTVYEPGIKQQANGRNSAHSPTYANTHNANSNDSNIIQRNPNDSNKQSVFNRLIGFFKKQNEAVFPPVNSRERPSLVNSGDSYDHLRPISGAQIELVPPISDPQHTYSHTRDISTQGIPATKDTNQQPQNADLPSVIVDDNEINAVHVGDAYIEFQVGPIDSNNPNLVKPPSPDTVNTERPAPPIRPPPSPGLGKKKDNTSQNLQANDSKNNRSPSPNLLSPDQAGSRSASPSSSISSHHSYKILEPHEIYDYADVSDDELGFAPHPPEDFYEDVDAKKVSVRKRPTRLPSEENQYLEPVTSKSSIALGSVQDTDKQTKNDAPKSQSSMLKRELKQKIGKNQGDKPADTKTPYVNSGVVNKAKDNKMNKAKPNELELVNKDKPTVNGAKGVLGMAKLFESGDSKNVNLVKRNAERNSSDV